MDSSDQLPSGACLQVTDLRKVYRKGVVANDGISLQIAPGDPPRHLCHQACHARVSRRPGVDLFGPGGKLMQVRHIDGARPEQPQAS